MGCCLRPNPSKIHQMTHRFPIKEIASQSGLSTATVDRVFNKRTGVSPQARARVAAAISELEGQERQISARGRRLFFDIVVEAPERFSREIRRAAEATLPTIGPAVIRPRYTFRQIMAENECIAALDLIAKRGSHGICLKARDLPGIRAAVDRLDRKGIPVVTVFTDITTPSRSAYSGPDNYAAGQTAGYLMDRFLTSQKGAVLATLSNADFHGEAQRHCGFRDYLERVRPDLGLIEANDGAGLNLETARLVQDAIATTDDICGVYSMGGANTAVLRSLQAMGQCPMAYIAHDLDNENLSLLRSGAITIVLQHDIQTDIRNAFLSLLHEHGLASTEARSRHSRLNVVTPMTIAT